MLDKIGVLYKSDNQRSKLVKYNVLLGTVARGVSVLSSLILVPLTINYISSELYGVWLTLSSVIHWIGFFDIGFGNGLRNRLGESIAVGKFKKGRIYVSTTYMVMTVIFLLIGGISFLGAGFINWSSFLNVSEQYNLMLVKVARILFLSFSIQMVLSLVQNVIQAYQLNALAAFLGTLGNILSLLFIYILTLTLAPDMTNIAFIFSISPLLILVIASVVLYGGRFKKVAPRFGYVRFRFAKDIFNLGSEFFIIQIASLVLYQMINVLISRICGPEEVTNYNIAYKYLSILPMLTTIIMAPIWSAFTDAYTKKDRVWMNSIYKKLLMMFYFSAGVAVLMIVISPFVYRIWIGNGIHITMVTSVYVGIYMIIAVWGQIHGTIINGTGKIRIQVIYSVIIMFLFLPLALLLGHIYKLNGIMLAMILVNAPGFIFAKYQTMGLINGTAKGLWNK